MASRNRVHPRMVWGKNRDQVELDEFGSGGPRYPGNGHTNHVSQVGGAWSSSLLVQLSVSECMGIVRCCRTATTSEGHIVPI